MTDKTKQEKHENVLDLPPLFAQGYGLTPQSVMRNEDLSLEAKGLYSYFASFAGAGKTAFPKTETILAELRISKTRFYKYRSELASWGYITYETIATPHGSRTVYTLPDNPIGFKDEVDQLISDRSNASKARVSHLHGDGKNNQKVQETAGQKPCPQNEETGQSRVLKMRPRSQNKETPCPQNEETLYIVNSNKGIISIDKSDGGTQQDGNQNDGGTVVDTVPTAPIDSLTDVRSIDECNSILSKAEFDAFCHLCSLSIKPVRKPMRESTMKTYAQKLTAGYSTDEIEKAYLRYADGYHKTNDTPTFAKQLWNWLIDANGLSFYCPKVAKKPAFSSTGGFSVASSDSSDPLKIAVENKNQQLDAAKRDPKFRELCNKVSELRKEFGIACVNGADSKILKQFQAAHEAAVKEKAEYFETHFQQAETVAAPANGKC